MLVATHRILTKDYLARRDITWLEETGLTPEVSLGYRAFSLYLFGSNLVLSSLLQPCACSISFSTTRIYFAEKCS